MGVMLKRNRREKRRVKGNWPILETREERRRKEEAFFSRLKVSRGTKNVLALLILVILFSIACIIAILLIVQSPFWAWVAF